VYSHPTTALPLAVAVSVAAYLRQNCDSGAAMNDEKHGEVLGSSWSVFVDICNEALAAPTPKSEDLVRYVYFQALLESGIDISHFAFEYPHPTIPRAQVDTVLVDAEGDPYLALEVKYHRNIPSGSNLPRPQLAGGLVHDLTRLSRFEPRECRRNFLYVTDEQMAGYLANPRNRLEWLLSTSVGTSQQLDDAGFDELSVTFQKAAGDVPQGVTITVIETADLVRGHTARLYDVHAANAPARWAD